MALSALWLLLLALLSSGSCKGFDEEDVLYRAKNSFQSMFWAVSDRMIIIPEYNFMFCWIEKVACTNFNKLFNVVVGHPERNAHSSTVYASRNTAGYFFDPKKGLKNARKVYHGVESILKNESWHKAVFFRHPVDRYLSSYRSQCTDNIHKPRHCHDTFGGPPRKPTLAETVNVVRSKEGRTFGTVTPRSPFIHTTGPD